MSPSSPRDMLHFPLSAALWAAGGSILVTLVSIAMTLRDLADDGDLPELALEILPGQAAHGLLGALLVATLVLVVAEHRQARRPRHVGHARSAAAATGLIPVLVGWLAVALASGVLFLAIPSLVSPIGFAVSGVLMSVVQAVAAVFGAAVGAAWATEEGEERRPTTPRREAWVGVLVFGSVLAFGVELVASITPALFHDTLGHSTMTISSGSAAAALAIGVLATSGYAWRRCRAPLFPARWRGDAFAALATVPVTLAVAATLLFGAFLFAYAMADNTVAMFVTVGISLLLASSLAFGVIGAITAHLRMRLAQRRH